MIANASTEVPLLGPVLSHLGNIALFWAGLREASSMTENAWGLTIDAAIGGLLGWFANFRSLSQELAHQEGEEGGR